MRKRERTNTDKKRKTYPSSLSLSPLSFLSLSSLSLPLSPSLDPGELSPTLTRDKEGDQRVSYFLSLPPPPSADEGKRHQRDGVTQARAGHLYCSAKLSYVRRLVIALSLVTSPVLRHVVRCDNDGFVKGTV